MIPPPVILSTLLALPPFALDHDTPDERRALLSPVADAISAVSRTREDAAFLIVQGWYESRYARDVLTGHCEQMPKGMRCDPDKLGRPRARGAWQVWRVGCKADDLTGQARCVIGTAKMGVERCGSWSAGFGALTGRWACTMRPEREQMMRAVLARWSK